MTSGLQSSSTSFLFYLQVLWKEMERVTKKGLRGFGKRKLAGMHIDLFFWLHCRFHHLPPLFTFVFVFTPPLHFASEPCFFPTTKTTLLRLTHVHILSKELDELR